MNTAHPTHPLFTSMRKGMGRLGGLGAGAGNATAHGYSGNADWGAGSGWSAFSSSTPGALFFLPGVCRWPNEPDITRTPQEQLSPIAQALQEILNEHADILAREMQFVQRERFVPVPLSFYWVSLTAGLFAKNSPPACP